MRKIKEHTAPVIGSRHGKDFPGHLSTIYTYISSINSLYLSLSLSRTYRPIVKVITWPETNPQLPRVLTNHIQHLINNHFPAPLTISNEMIQQMTLILLLTSQASELYDLQYESTNVNEKRSGRRKQRKVTLERLVCTKCTIFLLLTI